MSPRLELQLTTDIPAFQHISYQGCRQRQLMPHFKQPSPYFRHSYIALHSDLKMCLAKYSKFPSSTAHPGILSKIHHLVAQTHHSRHSNPSPPTIRRIYLTASIPLHKALHPFLTPLAAPKTTLLSNPRSSSLASTRPSSRSRAHAASSPPSSPPS